MADFTMYAVYRAVRGQGARTPESGAAAELVGTLDALPGLATRGWYDISGFRADADLLVWWHAGSVETLQTAYRAVLDAGSGALEAVWSAIGVHRPAEFNANHVPAFLMGEEPRGYVCVYPFTRGREWYLLPAEERRELLREHGLAARDYGDVRANTMSAFGLGDDEWLLAFEADELVRIVDLIRELRATGARRYVINELPFFTGPRVDAEEILARVIEVPR